MVYWELILVSGAIRILVVLGTFFDEILFVVIQYASRCGSEELNDTLYDTSFSVTRYVGKKKKKKKNKKKNNNKFFLKK